MTLLLAGLVLLFQVPPVDVVLDLAGPSEQALRVDPDAEAVRPLLANRLVGAAYEVQVLRDGEAPRPQSGGMPIEISAKACPDAGPGIEALQAVSAEEQIAAVRARVRESPAITTCRNAEYMRGALDRMARHILQTQDFDGHDTLTFLIRRSAPAARAWRFAVRRSGSGNAGAPTVLPAGEEGWIAGEILEDLRTMGPGSARLLRPTTMAHAWSSDAYLAAARVALAGKRCASGPGVVPPALADPTPEVLRAEDDRISARLRKCVVDAGAHEEAALLVAALALGEAAGPFSDVRPALNRITAHLAAARVGNAKPGVAARLAMIAVDALSARTAAAHAAVEQERKLRPDAVVGAWLDALDLRATGDWRPYPTAPAALLVRRELFRALVARTETDTAIARVPPGPRDGLDLARLVRETHFNVEAGHRFAADAVADEEEQTEAVASTLPWRLRQGPALHVLGPAAWRAFRARHVAAAAVAEDHHLANLGLPGPRASLRAAFLRDHADLELVPAVRRMFAERSVDDAGIRDMTKPDCADLAKLAGDRPELVTPVMLWTAWPACSMQREIKAAALWLARPAPRGTALDAMPRIVLSRLAGQPGAVATAEVQLAAIEPYGIHGRQAPRDVDPTPRAADAKPLADYDLRALHRMVAETQGTPAEIEWRRRMCALDTGSCFDLVSTLAARGQGDEAEKVFLSLLDGRVDEVFLANNMQWIVDRRLAQGRRDEALLLAERAGHTFSARGLFTLGTTLEALGRLAEAERVFQAIAERYGERGDVNAFYLRQGLKGGPYAARAQEVVRAAFPQGMQPWNGTEQDPPSRGLRITSITDERRAVAEKAGIAVLDIVVAVNGTAVANETQFEIARDKPSSDVVTLVLWRNGRYLTVSGTPPGRRYGLVMTAIDEQSSPAPSVYRYEGRTGPEWVKVLLDPSAAAEDTQRLFPALVPMGAAALAPVSAALQDKSPVVRSRAIPLFMQLAPPADLPRIAPLASDPDDGVREVAVRHMAFLATSVLLHRPEGVPAWLVDTLRKAARDKTAAVASRATSALEKIEPKKP